MSEKSTDYFMIKDIEKFIGISSNQLRDYDAKGVLSPTTYKNKEAVHNKGAWLYDDEAVKKLIKIRILQDAKYTMTEIAEFSKSLTDQQFMVSKYDEVLERLERERLELLGKKFWIMMQKAYDSVCVNYPELARLLENAEINLEKLSISKFLEFQKNMFIELAMEYGSELSSDEYEKMLPFLTMLDILYTVSAYSDKSADSEEFQSIVKEAEIHFLTYCKEYNVQGTLLDFSLQCVDEMDGKFLSPYLDAEDNEAAIQKANQAIRIFYKNKNERPTVTKEQIASIIKNKNTRKNIKNKRRKKK